MDQLIFNACSTEISAVLVYLFEIEFVAEHPLTVLTHPGLSRLPGGPQQSRHLVWAQQRGHLVCSAGSVHTLRQET